MNMQYIKENKIAVRCDNIDELNKLGIDEKATFYCVGSFPYCVRLHNFIMGGDVSYFKEEGYTIINFSDIDFEEEKGVELDLCNEVRELREENEELLETIRWTKCELYEAENKEDSLIEERVKRLEHYVYPKVSEKKYTMAEAIKEGLDFSFKGREYLKKDDFYYLYERGDKTDLTALKCIIPDWILEHQNEIVTIIKEK